MGTRYSALALDLDGTLLDEEGVLGAHVVAALRQATKLGVRVHLVSGRMLPSILPFWQQIGLDTPIIAYNGAKIQLPGQPPLSDRRLTPDYVRTVIAYCRTHKLSMNAYFEDKLYLLQDNQFGKWYSEYFKIPYYVLNEKEWPAESPSKLLLILENPEQVQQAFTEMSNSFPPGAFLTTSSGRFVEFLPEGVNKATALQLLATHINLPLNHWVAVGDGANDLEMLQECGIGLVVENAPEDVRLQIPQVVPPLPKGGIEQVLADFFGIYV